MAKKILSSILDYRTLVQTKLAAQALKEGFWMGDLTDFLSSNDVKIIGNPTNTSKWKIAKTSLQNIKNKKKLNRIFKTILENEHWYYSKPVEALDKLAKTIREISTKTTTGRAINLTTSSLHPVVKKVSMTLFQDGHYSQAILEAYKAVINEVKRISGLIQLDGKALMERAFSLNNPKIKLNPLQTQSQKDEQSGFMLLFGGAALGIRNPKAHDHIVQKDPVRALEYLNFASLLLKRLDERSL